MAPVKLDRLRSSRDVVAALRSRRQRGRATVVIHVRETDEERPARLTVLASRRVGGAVERNRAKRVLREAARTLSWRPGIDVVLVARAATASAPLRLVAEELERTAKDLDLMCAENAHVAPGPRAGSR